METKGAALRNRSSRRGTRIQSRVSNPSLRPPSWHRLIRAGDIVIASALGVFAAPLIAFIGVAIKLDSSGPVFCRQPRIGLIGRRFFVLKFRTVMHDPERASSGLRWHWHVPETRVGRFLSYTRMEDLPQLINVLRGEMTLIGVEGKPSIFAD